MKKGNIVIVNVVVIITVVVFAFVMILGNVGVVKSNVAVIPGSYGAKYAEEKKLNVVELADTQKAYFDQRYESFDYNENGTGLCLERYSGKSRELVIPAEIDGRPVTELGEKFLAGLYGVEKIYISSVLTTVDGEPVDKPVICCSEDNKFYNGNEDEGWTFELVYDSDFTNFFLGNIPFEYNLKGDYIELTNYSGSDDILVIPSYIDGCPVTNVAFDILTAASVIVIPETVTNISGESVKFLYTPVFAIEFVFCVLAFLLSLITVDVILPRYHKDQREYMLSGSQMVIVLLYVFAQTVFGILAIKKLEISAYLTLIVSLLILLVYVVLIISGNIGRSHVKNVDQSVIQKTERMKHIKQLSRGMADGIKDPELKKKVQRLEEEIRFSDPVSRDDLEEMERAIEDAITDLLSCKDKGDNDTLNTSAERIMDMIKNRNKVCKNGK